MASGQAGVGGHAAQCQVQHAARGVPRVHGAVAHRDGDDGLARHGPGKRPDDGHRKGQRQKVVDDKPAKGTAKRMSTSGTRKEGQK